MKHISITFIISSQVFPYSTEKHSSKDGDNDSHMLKIKKHVKDKYGEVALDHLRQNTTKKVSAKLSKIPKPSADHTKLFLMHSRMDSLEGEIYL